MRFWPLILAIALLAGCARFKSEPISPEKTASNFDARSLTNQNLQAFLETNRVVTEWPCRSWDLNALTFVAFHYQPALAEARAQYASVRAAEITAGERPNPTVGFTPTYDTTTSPPWILGTTWDIPIETAGKRGKRIAEANFTSEAAKWNFITTEWQTRSHVRGALLTLYNARQNESLLARQYLAQSNVVRLLQGQLEAGAISSIDVAPARILEDSMQLSREDAIGQLRQGTAQLAGLLGLPTRALDGIEFDFSELEKLPMTLTAPEIRRDAVLNRADIRAALANYAASQSALQLEVAKQYPDVHLNPGYELDQTDNKWSLGVTVDLPVLNQNQGGIAEAKAKRAEAAAHFLTVQATAISEIDAALAGYDAALQKSATAKKLLDDLQKQLDSVRAQARVGEADALALGQRRSHLLHRDAKSIGRPCQSATGARRTGRRGPKSADAFGGHHSHGAGTFSPTLKMKPKQIIIGLVMLVCAGLAIFGLIRLEKSSGGDPDDQSSEAVPSVVSVQTGTLKRMTLHRSIDAYGTVEPAPATADQPSAGGVLSASSAGVVARVAVVAGQEVKEGDVLVELNSPTITFKNAKAAVERQKKLFADQNTSLKNLQDAESQFASLQITTPVSGTVTRISARPGAAVDANAVVAEVMDLNRLIVSAQIPATTADDLKVNQEVQISTNSSLTTSLSFISPAIEPADGTILTRAALPPNSGLRPGQFVPLKIITAVHTNCLAAPAESVITDDDGKSVIALVKGEQATQVPVTIGLRENGWVEIEGADLKEGDSVVTVGAYGLPKETKIRTANSPADEATSTNEAPAAKEAPATNSAPAK